MLPLSRTSGPTRPISGRRDDVPGWAAGPGMSRAAAPSGPPPAATPRTRRRRTPQRAHACPFPRPV